VETWAAWQELYDQCHIVEGWLTATEQSLEVRHPAEDITLQVIALCLLAVGLHCA